MKQSATPVEKYPNPQQSSSYQDRIWKNKISSKKMKTNLQ